MNLQDWESKFELKMAELVFSTDSAHDLLHFKRVTNLAKQFCKVEGGNPEIAIPAAWLHDFVIIPKDSPLRNQASKLSAEKAITFLRSIGYSEKFYDEIAHAILAHSFSANVETKTIEAKIVQDADRLDGLGAIGIARCFATAGLLKREFYNFKDPFCEFRQPDDSQYAIDHFFKKLFKTAESLKTKSGIEEGYRRVEVMKIYLSSLESELK